MFEILSKRFVLDYNNIKDKNVRAKLISLSSVLVTAINVFLFLVKIILGLLIGSMAIISDAFNNLSDVLCSLISLIGSKMSLKPADKDHPLGHGRSEYIASFVVSIIIMFVGVELFRNSFVSFFEKKTINISSIGLIILAITTIFKLYTYFLNRKLYKKLDSNLNYAIALDSKNDILATSVIIISLIIQRYVKFNIDSLLGLLVSILVFKPGVELAKETIDCLLGKKIDDEIVLTIENIIKKSPLVVGFHDLRIHDYGNDILMGSCHMEVAGNLDVLTVHEEIDKLEKQVKNQTGVDITIHMDPTFCITSNEVKKLEKSDINEDKNL